jgi:hypothetical protein
LRLLGGEPSRAARITVFKDHTAALEALRAHGFEERRTLLTLRRDFRRRG